MVIASAAAMNDQALLQALLQMSMGLPWALTIMIT
jgi:hypothetical protein